MKRFGLLLSAAVMISLAACSDDVPDHLTSPAAVTAVVTQTPAHTDTQSPAAQTVEQSGHAGQGREATAAEIMDKLGIPFHLPESAEDVAYSIVEQAENPAVAQARFNLDGVQYEYRICSDASLRDISGVDCEWKAIKSVQVSYCNGEIRLNEGEQGVCLWYDVVPGLMYSLYMEAGASEEALLRVAEKVFVPLQEH